MANSSKYWDNRAIRRLTDAEKQGEAYSKRIQKIYEQAYRDIQRDIDNIYANYSKAAGLDIQSLKTLLTKSETDKLWKVLKLKGLDQYVKGNYKARISRLEKLQAQIYAKAKEIYPKEQLEHTMCYEGVINNSYYKAIYDTQMGTGLDFAFSKIDENTVSSLLNERWSGKNYSQRIWGNTDILAGNLSEIIGGGMVSGQSLAKTSRQVRERFNVAKYYADRLVRTEVNHFNNEADAMAYEEMGLDKYVFLATLDTRTSTICQELDNEVFELKDRQVGKNFPPMHVNCRSKTRAYMGAEIEATLNRRARNPITNETEIIDNISYKKWAKKHELDEQQKQKLTTHNASVLKNKPNDVIIKGKPLLTMNQTVNKAKEIAKSPEYANVNTMQELRAITNIILGYDGLPVVVNPKEFETLSKSNTVLYRGIHASKTKTALEIVEEFKSGAFWTGNTGQAVFGNGAYFTATESLAKGEYAGNNGVVIEILLNKNAKVADYQTIYKEFFETGIPKIIGTPNEDYQMIIRDVGQYSAVKGYDAIALNGFQGHDYVILLNRTKCIVKG